MRRLALILSMLPLPVLAQPLGVAFIQAPEQYSGVFTAPDLREATVRGTAECLAAGAMAEDCAVQSWCHPAGWSIDIFAQHQEGLHWHEFHCGLPDEATAMAVGETLCDRTNRPYLTECLVVQLYDPEGQAQH